MKKIFFILSLTFLVIINAENEDVVTAVTQQPQKELMEIDTAELDEARDFVKRDLRQMRIFGTLLACACPCICPCICCIFYPMTHKTKAEIEQEAKERVVKNKGASILLTRIAELKLAEINATS